MFSHVGENPGGWWVRVYLALEPPPPPLIFLTFIVYIKNAFTFYAHSI